MLCSGCYELCSHPELYTRGGSTVAPAPGSIRALGSQPKAKAEAIFFNTLSKAEALHCQAKTKAEVVKTQAMYNAETMS